MAKNNSQSFRLKVTMDCSSPVVSCFDAAAGASRKGRRPNRPPDGFRFCDGAWEALKKSHKLADLTASGIDVRARLEQEIGHVRLAVVEELRAAPLKDKERQLGRIAVARIGAPIKRPMHRHVLGLLAGMAMLDLRHGRRALETHTAYMTLIRAAKFVTPELRDWACWCVMSGAGDANPLGLNGGAALAAELAFVSVILNFWTDVLDRPSTAWVGEKVFSETIARPYGKMGRVHHRVESADARTRFAHDLFAAAGIQDRAREPLSLAATHARVVRAERKMKEAVAMGLSRNAISYLLAVKRSRLGRT